MGGCKWAVHRLRSTPMEGRRVYDWYLVIIDCARRSDQHMLIHKEGRTHGQLGRDGALHGVDRRALFEDCEGRHRRDSALLRDVLGPSWVSLTSYRSCTQKTHADLVHVDLVVPDLSARVGRSELLEDGRDHLARATPSGPEVDDGDGVIGRVFSTDLRTLSISSGG